MKPPSPFPIRPSRAIAIAAAALLAACADNPSASLPSSTTVRDSAGIRIVTSDPWSPEAHCTLADNPTLSLGTAEGDGPDILFRVLHAARLSDGSVAVLDGSSGEIRVFGETGEHLRSMGRRGEGPGEFRGPWLFWVLPGDTLWASDYTPWRFNVFSVDGAFDRSVQPRDFSLWVGVRGGVLDGGTSINVTQAPPGAGGSASGAAVNFLVIAHGPDGTVLDTLETLPGGSLVSLPDSDWGGFLPPLFDPSSLVAAGSSTIAMTTAREPEVRLLDEELQLRHLVRWSEPDREVTDSHVKAYREEYIDQFGGPGSQGWSAGNDAYVSDRRPVAELFPTASDLTIGRDGRIWLKRYERPREEASWMAFNANGDFSCHFRPVPELTPFECGADYLLGLQRDGLGVERVVMYELEERSGAGRPGSG